MNGTLNTVRTADDYITLHLVYASFLSQKMKGTLHGSLAVQHLYRFLESNALNVVLPVNLKQHADIGIDQSVICLPPDHFISHRIERFVTLHHIPEQIIHLPCRKDNAVESLLRLLQHHLLSACFQILSVTFCETGHVLPFPQGEPFFFIRKKVD